MNKETRVWIEDRMFREMQVTSADEWCNLFGSFILMNLKDPRLAGCTILFHPDEGGERLIMTRKDGRTYNVYMPKLNALTGIAYTQVHNFLRFIADVLDDFAPADFEGEYDAEKRAEVRQDHSMFGAGA